MSDGTNKDTNKGNRLTKKQWQEIAAIWAMGEMRLMDIAEKYSVRRETVSRKMKEWGIRYGEKAEEHRKKVHEELVRADVWNAKIIAKRQIDTKQFHYNNATVLAKAGMKIVADAMKNGVSLASVEPDLRSIERALSIQQKAFDQRAKATDMDKEDEQERDLPELIIRGMTEDEVKEVQREAELRSGVVPLEQLETSVDELEEISRESEEDIKNALNG